MTENAALAPLLALANAWATTAEELPCALRRTGSARLTVFLDCRPRVAAFFRSLIDFVEYVDDPRDADVRIAVKASGSRGRTRTYNIEFIGLGRFENVGASARVDDAGGRAARRGRDVLAPPKKAPAAVGITRRARRWEGIGRPA